MRAFRKNYKLDFIEIDDVDEWDEYKVEAKIVENIKRFIMALGADFSYMGNQYRLIVDDKEYFIDLRRTRQTLWSAVQMLTQKLCCQTIHDCPKVVPLHYESE